METAVQEKLETFRQGIAKVEDTIKKMPTALIGDSFPLKHQFAEGIYVRQMDVPKGFLVITKIHKFDHPCFILKGKCSVWTEKGIQRIQAPHYMITKAGTKRIVYVHEDTTWVTCHATREKDLDKIEDEVIAKSFDEIKDAIDIEAFVVEAQKGDEHALTLQQS